jgi:hypothetical protein
VGSVLLGNVTVTRHPSLRVVPTDLVGEVVTGVGIDWRSFHFKGHGVVQAVTMDEDARFQAT